MKGIECVCEITRGLATKVRSLCPIRLNGQKFGQKSKMSVMDKTEGVNY